MKETLPITRTFKGNRNEISSYRELEANSRRGKGKTSLYCTENILITFNCRNVKSKLKDTRKKHSLSEQSMRFTVLSSKAVSR